MKKLNLTLVLALVSILSYGQAYGQVVQGNEEQKSSTAAPEPIRKAVDGTYVKEDVHFTKPLQLPYLREADVYWSSLIWQVIDLRQKFNFPLYFPTEVKGNWKSFMQAILDAIDSTETNPNPLRIYTDEYVHTPVSATELKKSMGESQTQQIFDPETFEYIKDTVLFIPFGAKEVYRYVVKEQWRIDKKRSMMDQVIISICPMFWYEKLDFSGGDDGGGGGGDDADFAEEDDDMPAMPARRWREFGWIYYPELRPMMAVTEVFNPGNNAQRRNYDDIFLQRHFTSFIKAAENVHDNRDINMYFLNGLDQTLEADRIKESIRIREHDMWEY